MCVADDENEKERAGHKEGVGVRGRGKKNVSRMEMEEERKTMKGRSSWVF